MFFKRKSFNITRDNQIERTYYQASRSHLLLLLPFLFGLCNGIASFQDFINKILAEKLNIFVIFYLEDIFIYTKNPGKGHIELIW